MNSTQMYDSDIPGSRVDVLESDIQGSFADTQSSFPDIQDSFPDIQGSLAVMQYT